MLVDLRNQCKELYVRKVNSVDSKELLDRLDKINNTSTACAGFNVKK